jgi:serine/threonine protein kinase
MSLLASIPSELLKNWEGRVIDGQFRLQKWLGGSDHSAVFLTERNGKDPYKAAIKLVWTESLSTDLMNQDLMNQDSLNPDSLHEEAQLSRWRETAKLSHPHLIRLFESGRGTIDNRRFVYIVMEYAEEDLGQILPARALSSEEVAGMLPPTANAIQFLHQAGFVHGRIKPSNVMAVSDQLKISMDGLGRPGERVQAKSSYDAPELTSHRMTPAADVWSLGAMLVAVLTQDPPKVLDGSNQKALPAIPETMQEPFRSIARRSRTAWHGQQYSRHTQRFIVVAYDGNF